MNEKVIANAYYQLSDGSVFKTHIKFYDSYQSMWSWRGSLYNKKGGFIGQRFIVDNILKYCHRVQPKL